MCHDQLSIRRQLCVVKAVYDMDANRHHLSKICQAWLSNQTRSVGPSAAVEP